MIFFDLIFMTWLLKEHVRYDSRILITKLILSCFSRINYIFY